jgi:hypothetical protein
MGTGILGRGLIRDAVFLGCRRPHLVTVTKRVGLNLPALAAPPSPWPRKSRRLRDSRRLFPLIAVKGLHESKTLRLRVVTRRVPHQQGLASMLRNPAHAGAARYFASYRWWDDEPMPTRRHDGQGAPASVHRMRGTASG